MEKLREVFETFNKKRTINRNMNKHPDGTYENPERECAWQYYKEGAISHESKHETVEQWEERTGLIYPDDGPVWIWAEYLSDFPYGQIERSEWRLEEYSYIDGTSITKIKCIIANHHGKPDSIGG